MGGGPGERAGVEPAPEPVWPTTEPPTGGPAVAAAPRQTWQTAGWALAALLTGAALTLTGLMLWQHAQASAQRADERRFVEAASAGVTALLSVDHAHARADVQRMLDLSTGQFHDRLAATVDDFVKTAEKAKAVTKGSVNLAALDSVEGNRAVVLVSATSEVTNANGAHEDSRPFRVTVTVTRDGDAYKMSGADVERLS